MGTLEAIFVSIIAGIILFFILPFFKKPRDRFIAWIKKKFVRKKKEKKVVIIDPNKDQKLEQLAQRKFNKERENIDPELNKNIRDVMKKFSINGILYSGMFFSKAVELHAERIHKLLEARKTINREVFLNNIPIENNKEIEIAMRDLEKIAEAQKTAIFGCAHIFNQSEKNNFVREMSWNIARILSNIRRDLAIEKDENLLLRREETNLNSKRKN